MLWNVVRKRTVAPLARRSRNLLLLELMVKFARGRTASMWRCGAQFYAALRAQALLAAAETVSGDLEMSHFACGMAAGRLALSTAAFRAKI